MYVLIDVTSRLWTSSVVMSEIYIVGLHVRDNWFSCWLD